MNEGEPYGHLSSKGVKIELSELAHICRVPTSTVVRLVRELEATGSPGFRVPCQSDFPASSVPFSRRWAVEDKPENADKFREFERELKEQRKPSTDIAAIPLRLIL